MSYSSAMELLRPDVKDTGHRGMAQMRLVHADAPCIQTIAFEHIFQVGQGQFAEVDVRPQGAERCLDLVQLDRTAKRPQDRVRARNAALGDRLVAHLVGSVARC